MVDLCEEGKWPSHALGGWKDRLQDQLGQAYHDFKQWSNQNCILNTVPPFTVCGLHMSAQTDWPWMRSKAANAAYVSMWLETVTGEFSDGSQLHETRHAMFWGFGKIIALFKEPNQEFTDDQVATLIAARKACLFGYLALASAAAESVPLKARYNMKPKFHQFDHRLRRAIVAKANPGFWWTFADEDMLGTMSRLASSCHGSTLGNRCAQRWLLWYFQEACKKTVSIVAHSFSIRGIQALTV